MGRRTQGTFRTHSHGVSPFSPSRESLSGNPTASAVLHQAEETERPAFLPEAQQMDGRMEELRSDVWGSMSQVVHQAIAAGIQSLVEELDLALKHRSCPELRLLRDALLLLADPGGGPETDETIIYTELLARLHSLQPAFPGLLGPLCQQCKAWFASWPHPVLIPLCGFLSPPDGPLRRTLAGSATGTSLLEVSMDQRLLLAGSQDGSMTVWAVQEDFAVRNVLLGHSAEVKCATVFGQGTRIASVALDQSLRLWRLDSGRETSSVRTACMGEQWCRLYVDERNQLVYWASGSEVNSWHLGSLVPAFQIPSESPGGWLCAAVFAPRQVVVTLSERGGLGLWDGVSGGLHLQQELPGLSKEAPVCSLLLQKTGRLVAGFSGGSLWMVSSDGTSLREQLPEGLRLAALSGDETLLATGFGRRVRLFLPKPMGFQKFLNSDLLHDGEVSAVAFSADNTAIITSSELDECLWVWHLSQLGSLASILGNSGPPATRLTLCGHLLVSASHQDPRLRVWDLSCNCEQKALPPCTASASCMRLSQDGNSAYFPAGRDSCSIVIWDSAEGKVCETLDASAPVTWLEVAEGSNLLFAGLESGTVLVFPLDSKREVGCVPPAENQKPVRGLALTQRGEQLAVASEDLVRVLNIEREGPWVLISQPAYTFYTQIPGTTISSLALLPEYWVLYGMTNGELFLYHCPRGQVFPLEAHTGSITCLKTSHGEKWALSGSTDSLCCLWDVELRRWEHRMFFQKHDSFSHGVLCACFSRDDRYVFVASGDQCVTVWDVLRGALLALQPVHARVTAMLPTTDGFAAATQLGHLIRERFRCPPSISPCHDPLRSLRATCRVESRSREGGGPVGDQRKPPQGRPRQGKKLSQICRVV